MAWCQAAGSSRRLLCRLCLRRPAQFLPQLRRFRRCSATLWLSCTSGLATSLRSCAISRSAPSTISGAPSACYQGIRCLRIFRAPHQLPLRPGSPPFRLQFPLLEHPLLPQSLRRSSGPPPAPRAARRPLLIPQPFLMLLLLPSRGLMLVDTFVGECFAAPSLPPLLPPLRVLPLRVRRLLDVVVLPLPRQWGLRRLPLPPER